MGLKRRLVLTLPHMYAAPALIASSDMIATIMEGVVSASGHAGKLAVLKLPLQLEPVQFMMSWHRRNDTHPAQRWFRSCVLRSEEHTSELQSLMRNSYAVFCLNKKKKN